MKRVTIGLINLRVNERSSNITYINVNVFFMGNHVNNLWITCEKYTCILHVITWKPHNTHYIEEYAPLVCRENHTKQTQNNMWQCVILMWITKFTCERPKYTSVWFEFACDLQATMRNLYRTQVGGNLNCIITFEAAFKNVIKWFHIWTSSKEYRMWISIMHMLKHLSWQVK